MTITLSTLAFEYADHTAQQAVAAYQKARDSWLQRRLFTIIEAGMRIGTTLDTARTAQELADVGADHFADLVTVDLLDAALQEEGTHPADGPPELRRIAHSVADAGPDPAAGTGRGTPTRKGPSRLPYWPADNPSASASRHTTCPRG
ncbi:hypothetical protein ACFQ0Q_02690 [Streptomyces aureus]